MNRIEKTLIKGRDRRKKMLSPYITAGDPEPGMTVDIMHALVAAGADILELGIPFSDPMAEGPVIQAAMERALHHHMDCDQVFTLIQTFRKKDKDTPIVLMGYLNPIEQYGYQPFAKQAALVGVDGIIVVDLPPEECTEFELCWHAEGLYNIFLCSPTTSEARMMLLKKYAHGYLYYVSLKGVSGSDAFDLQDVKTQYEQRKTQSNLPIMVGFGIKTPEMAAQVASFADGVIVGASLVTAIHEAYIDKKDCIKAGAQFIESMRMAIDKQES
jgi:tryptophan synthase alpha chain